MIFNGLRVRTNLWLTDPKEMMVWEPAGGGWMKHVLRVVQVPSDRAVMVGDIMYVHPARLEQMRKALA